ncbi:MAG TPA: hypothetical protein VFE33_33225 [Thermoanaerobaculia bacterium]|nr:hypothetical protein [Thermoanaerobaculia bacterium]
MKIEASLLRPVVDITADVDFCVNPHLNAVVNIPPLQIDVLKIPFDLAGGLNVPQLIVPPIPIHLTNSVVIFGLQIATINSNGSIGGFSAHLAGPIGLTMNGSLGGITATAQLREPIAMNLDGCLQGVARLNPKNLQTPDCCEGYREPLCCSCHVHKDHKYCEKTCGCYTHDRGPEPE